MISAEFLAVIAVFVLTVTTGLSLYRGFDQSFRPMQRRVRDLGAKIRMSEGTYEKPEEVGIAEIISWLQQRLPDPKVQKAAVEKLVQTLQYAGFDSPDAAKFFTLMRLGA